MKDNKKELLRAIILAALIIAPGFTPYGLIPLGLINITILHIPVIIGAVTLRRGTSVFLSVLFGVMSTLAAFGLTYAPQSGAVSMLLSYSAISVIVLCVVPRILIPIMTRLAFDAMHRRRVKLSRALSISALIGSLTNSVAYLGFMGILYTSYGIGEYFTAVFTPALGIGVACEALAAMLITDAVATLMIRADERARDLPKPTPLKDEDLAVPLSDDISSVNEVSVAVIPAMDMLLPAMDEVTAKKHDRCSKYLDDGNVLMADKAFDAFISGFGNDDDIWGASVYAIMRFIELSKYLTAGMRLCRMLRSSNAPVMVTSDHKLIYLGIMNIIHTSVMNDAQNPVKSAAAEPIFKEAGDLITAESLTEAADCLENYLNSIGAYDRVIAKTESYEPVYENIHAAQAAVREISDDELSEGVSEHNMAVIPTAASVSLPDGADFTQALKLMSIGGDAYGAFEDVICAVPDEKGRMEADRFRMLTYFERNDYVHALFAAVSAMKRDYSTEIWQEDSIKSTVLGILKISHAALRLQSPDNKDEADRIMAKTVEFFDKSMIVLCVQLLEKYFFITGVAKKG